MVLMSLVCLNCKNLSVFILLPLCITYLSILRKLVSTFQTHPMLCGCQSINLLALAHFTRNLLWCVMHTVKIICVYRNSHFFASIGGSQYRQTLFLVSDGVGYLTLHLTKCSQVIPTITPPD